MLLPSRSPLNFGSTGCFLSWRLRFSLFLRGFIAGGLQCRVKSSAVGPEIFPSSVQLAESGVQVVGITVQVVGLVVQVLGLAIQVLGLAIQVVGLVVQAVRVAIQVT